MVELKADFVTEPKTAKKNSLLRIKLIEFNRNMNASTKWR